MSAVRRGALLALAAAVLFGVTAPLVKLAGVNVGAFTTAAILYAGACLATLDGGKRTEAPLARTHAPRLVVAAVLGACAGPTLLAWGLQHASATVASLLLNLEAVGTVILARVLYREHVGGRVVLAMLSIFCAGAILVLHAHADVGFAALGLVAVACATFMWSLDNALTRPLADLDPVRVVRWKAGLGALLSVALAFVFDPSPRAAGWQLVLLLASGALGYGLSLRVYLVAQRRIGAGRTASVFAIAPFLGAVVAWAIGREEATASLGAAALLMALGVLLHATEKHAHRHAHTAGEHDHPHTHDDGHHDHVHDPPVVGRHSHVHRHERLEHAHEHGEDVDHRHEH